MNRTTHRLSARAFTLIEGLVVVAVIVLLATVLFPRRQHATFYAKRIGCVNNLKQIGLAFGVFATANTNVFPTQAPVSAGGSTSVSNALRHFQAVSSGLNTPALLVCPADTRRPASGFAVLSNASISYFLGLDAKESDPQTFLAGDCNLMTNGVPVGSGLLDLTTNLTVGWTAQLHYNAGNVLFGDGHVDALSNNRLQECSLNSGIATNRLLIP